MLPLACAGLSALQMHDHPAPEKLGQVSFPTSCAPATQAEFDRGIALLHSFAYSAASASFRKVTAAEPRCAIAHWGVAMSCFHQLWEPQISHPCLPIITQEIEIAQTLEAPTARERGYIQALSQIARNAGTVPFSTRDLNYETAMATLAHDNKNDGEAQVFYALALLSNAAPTDKTHARQKQALAILEPLDKKYPDHPGITHYIIHASDSGELAQQGLPAARKYAQIAPSAPHALHMPSHIFTRLGLWQDSITSNLAAAKAAREQGDTGEELHAMDYLVYADLQLGRYDDAHQVLNHLNSMNNVGAGDFKSGYAATAIPVRFAVEQKHWDDAVRIQPVPGSSQYVAAIAVWAGALGRARGQHSSDVSQQTASLQQLEMQLRAAGADYWATQVSVLQKEAMAWASQAAGKSQEAEQFLRTAADEEDAIDKSPATPGPIVPAREQLGELLLQQGRTSDAAIAFRASLLNSPGRLGAINGLEQSTRNGSEK